MKEKTKVKLKGMTLMECIISIFVLAALAMIVVVGGVGAIGNIRTAKSVSDKNASQSAFASEKLGGDKTGTMKIELNGAGGSGSLNVDTYEVRVNEGTEDKVGNYRYFSIPTTSPT